MLADAGLNDVIKIFVILTDPSDVSGFKEVYTRG